MIDYKSLPATSGTYSDAQIPPLPLSIYESIPNVTFDKLPVSQIELFCRLRNSSILISSVYSRNAAKVQQASSSLSDFATNDSLSQLALHLEANEQYVLKARLSEEYNSQREISSERRRIAWLLAAILYTIRVLSFSVSSISSEERRAVMERLVNALQDALLTELEPSGTKQRKNPETYAPSVVLWMLLLGGALAFNLGLPQAQWFGVALRLLSKVLGLNTWTEAKQLVRHLPWSDEVIGAEWRVWWKVNFEETKS
jgi:hypothetical protein